MLDNSMNRSGFAARAGFASLTLLFISQSAVGQGNIARCFSIQNVNERVNCLEGNGASRDTPQPANRFNTVRVLPSFDCRAAAHSIERAICGDPMLSEWDARMAQRYQQTLNARRLGEAQALVESSTIVDSATKQCLRCGCRRGSLAVRDGHDKTTHCRSIRCSAKI